VAKYTFLITGMAAIAALDGNKALLGATGFG
jgi:hypothetical protein